MRMEEQAELNNQRRQVEAQKQVVLRQQAQVWSDTDRLRAERNDLEHQLSIVKRDKDMLANRELEVQKREDLRRRNRYVRSI